MSVMASQITSLTQPFIQAQIKENIKFSVTGLCDQWIPGTEGQ